MIVRTCEIPRSNRIDPGTIRRSGSCRRAGLGQAVTPVVMPQPSPPLPQIYVAAVPPPAPPPLNAAQLALVQAGVPGVTPATNPSLLTPDQLAQLQAFQFGQSLPAGSPSIITAGVPAGLSPVQLALLQMQSNPYGLPTTLTADQQAAATTYTTSFGQFLQGIPNSYYIGGAVLLAVVLMMGRHRK